MPVRLIEIGAKPSVILSAGVTHVVVLHGGAADKRMSRVRDRALPLLTSDVLGAATTAKGAPSKEEEPAAVVDAPQMLGRGAVMDLPLPIEPYRSPWHGVEWSAAVAHGFEIDVVAFELGADDGVASDDDFVFFNQQVSGSGGVTLSIDGNCEHGVHIDLTSLDPATERVAIAAAIGAATTFGHVGASSVEVAGRDTAVASAVLDAGTSGRTMLIAEVYRRNDRRRLRAIGQGYDHGLAELVAGLGAQVED